MGLFGGLDGPTYQLRERLFSIGDDSWIEDERGHKAYLVDGKAMRLRKTFLLKDAHGHEVAKVQDKFISIGKSMTIESGDVRADVSKALISIRSHYTVKVDGGQEYTVRGDIVDHEYEIDRDGDKVAQISKKWFRIRDTYGVQVARGESVPLVLAIAVCVDEMSRH